MTLLRRFTTHRPRLSLCNIAFSGAAFFSNRNWIMISENDRDRRWVTSRIYDLANPDDEPRVFVDRSVRDRYGDPGRLLSTNDERGFSIALQHGEWFYLAGQGATPEGFLPFLDRRSSKTLQTERLWRCQTGELESVAMVLSPAKGTKLDPSQHQPKFITRHESPTSPPNFIERDLADGSKKPITDFQDPTPQIRGIKKQLVKYQRRMAYPSPPRSISQRTIKRARNCP